MEEKELEIMEDGLDEEEKDGKKGLIVLFVVIAAIAFLGILAGGIIGGSKYLASKGIIEEPAFLKAIGASNSDADELQMEGDTESEDIYGNGTSSSEGGLIDNLNGTRTAAEAALNGKSQDEIDALTVDEEDVEEEKEDDKNLSDDDKKEESKNEINKNRTKKAADAKRNSRVASVVSNNNIGLIPNILSGSSYYTTAGSGSSKDSSRKSSGGSSGHSDGSSSGSSSSGSSSSGGGSDTPTPTPTPSASPTPEPTPTVAPTPTPLPVAINAKSTVKELSDVEDYAKVIAPSVAKSYKKLSTVMVYLCGSDLEDEEGLATDALVSMLSSQYDTRYVNVVVCAGGTKQWNNGYLSTTTKNNDDNVKFYYLDNEGYLANGSSVKTEASTKKIDSSAFNTNTLKLIGSCKAMDMGDPKLLAGFINMATDTYPAFSYDLLMWNHGGGITDGVCMSDSIPSPDNPSVNKIDGTSIEAWELEDALRASNLYLTGGKLDFIGFDACYMASTELAYNLSPYCKYLIGSEEITYGNWDYKSMLEILSQHSSYDIDGDECKGIKKDTAKKIANEYFYYNRGSDSCISTIACVDMSKIGDMASAINTVSDNIQKLWTMTDEDGALSEFQADCFRAYKQARIHSLNAGLSEKSREQARDYVDIRDFLRNLEEYFGKISTSGNPEAAMLKGDILESIDLAISKVNASTSAGVTFNGGIIYKKDLTGKKYTYDSHGNPVETDTVGDITTFWNDFNGIAMSGISVYVPYYSSSNYAAFKDSTDPTVSYFDMDILSDFAKLNEIYAGMTFGTEEVSRIKRLASVIDYGKIFEVAKSENAISKNTGYVEKNSVYKPSGNEYLSIQIKEAYDDGDAPVVEDPSGDIDVSSDNPYMDFVDTVEDVKAVVAATLGDEGSEKTYYLGSKSLGLGVINGNNESISVLTSAVAGAVKDARDNTVYYLNHKTSEGGEDVSAKEAYIASISEDDTAIVIQSIIRDLNKSRAADKQLSDYNTENGNYAIFSGKYTTLGAAVPEGGGYVYLESEPSEAIHLFAIDENNKGTYIASVKASGASEPVYEGVASVSKITFTENVIENHGVVITDSIKIAVSEFSGAYELCKTAITDIADSEIDYTLEIDSIAGTDAEGNTTGGGQFIMSNDFIPVTTLPAVSDTSSTEKSHESSGYSSNNSSESSGGSSQPSAPSAEAAPATDNDGETSGDDVQSGALNNAASEGEAFVAPAQEITIEVAPVDTTPASPVIEIVSSPAPSEGLGSADGSSDSGSSESVSSDSGEAGGSSESSSEGGE